MGARILNILFALDIFLVALTCLGGAKRYETASAAAWSMERDGRWQGRLLRPLIDYFASLLGDYNHCQSAYDTLARTTGDKQ